MSDDSFNPYHTWLGLDRTIQSPNHYQLLGLDPAEPSPQRIAEAASRAMARVRSCRPGNRAAQWTQLLEQITAAATCLADPRRRAEYDRQLGGGAAAGRSYSRPAPRSRVAPAPGGAAQTLPMQAPQSVPMARPQGVTGPVGYADPMAPVVPAGPAATPGYGQVPGYGAPQARPVSGAAGYGVPPVAPAPLAAGRPVAAAPVGRPVAPIAAAAAPLAGRNRSAASQARGRAQHSNLNLLAICAGVGMLMLAAAIVVVVLTRKPEGRGRADSSPVVRSQPVAPQSRTKTQATARPVRPTVPVRREPDANLPATSLPAMPGGVPEAQPSPAGELSLPSFPAAPTVEQLAAPASPTPAAQPESPSPDANPETAMPAEPPSAEPQPSAPAAEPQPPEPAPQEPAAKEPEPAKPEPAKPETTKPEPAEPKTPESAATEPAPASASVTPEDIAALAKTLRAARAAIQDGRYDAAIAELDKVESLPKSPEHHARYDRLSLLAGYAKDFQAALKSSVASLQPGDEIEVGSNSTVGFVSAGAGSITVRVTGTNRTYALDRLPVGLAVALVDRWLKKDDSVSATIKGAYLASLRDLDGERRTKARQWLEEGSRKGVEGELQKVLDDRYDLEKETP